MKQIELTKGESLFIDQMTRKIMVIWCYEGIQSGGSFHFDEKDSIYLDYAKHKKWVSSDGTHILSAGWRIAAQFLKR